MHKPTHRRGIYHRIRPRVFISPWEKSRRRRGEIWENWNPFSVARFPEETTDETWHERWRIGVAGVRRASNVNDSWVWWIWLETSEMSIHGEAVSSEGEVAFICSWKTKAEQQGLRSLFIALDGGSAFRFRPPSPSNRRRSLQRRQLETIRAKSRTGREWRVRLYIYIVKSCRFDFHWPWNISLTTSCIGRYWIFDFRPIELRLLNKFFSLD